MNHPVLVIAFVLFILIKLGLLQIIVIAAVVGFIIYLLNPKKQ